MIYYEDLVVGSSRSSAREYEVTREEVIEFASKYDPQPFHLDDAIAAKTFFGRLSASGWHTAAMVMRLQVETMLNDEEPLATLGSPGIDELKWLQPVFPGDRIRYASTIASKRRMSSRPDIGLYKLQTEVFNQNNEIVMTMIQNALVSVRDPNQSTE